MVYLLFHLQLGRLTGIEPVSPLVLPPLVPLSALDTESIPLPNTASVIRAFDVGGVALPLSYRDMSRPWETRWLRCREPRVLPTELPRH